MHRPQLAASWQGAEALRVGSASSGSKLFNLRSAPLSGLFYLPRFWSLSSLAVSQPPARSGPAHSSWLPQHK